MRDVPREGMRTILAEALNHAAERVQKHRLGVTAGRRDLRAEHRKNGVHLVVLKTERALLQEVIEWHSLTSFAESH